VVFDEGLYSYKAVVFIATNRKNRVSSETISYLELGASRQKTVLIKQQETVRCISKNLGGKIYG
jgi:hypothetical protein